MSSSDSVQRESDDAEEVSRARATVRRRVAELGREHLSDEASLVASELMTNAVLHAGGCTGVSIEGTDDGVRIEVRDDSKVPPMLGRPSEESLTGRGLRLVASLAARWGADADGTGKVVWAELTGERPALASQGDADDLLAMWDDDWDAAGLRDRRYEVELGDVPTDLLLAAKSHVDNVVREFTLAAAGARAGQTPEVPAHLASLLAAVVDRFADARLAIKRQALAAAERGDIRTRLTLDLPATAADAAEEYARALDEVDAYCRARRMLTLETPPQHRVFRRWYIEQLVAQLRAAAAGKQPPAPEPFERRLLSEVDRLSGAQRAADRAARLYSVAAALAMAGTPEAVAEAVLSEGVTALGAAAGGVLLASDAEHLSMPRSVGYNEAVVARLRTESRDAELPAAVAFRTGQAVWLESRAERDEQFSELVGLEASTAALCAVPLEVQGRRLGALRFSFTDPRLFDEDERRFVLALAAQTAHAFDRAELQRARIDVSRRLQRSLLPPTVPEIPGLQVAAIYHPFGNEMDVGGDFYDIWGITPERWAIAIGDASGTGPEAAALTALVRHTMRALTLTSNDPERVMSSLNKALLDAAGAEADERFCTAIFGIVTPGDAMEIRLASGGHPPPFIRRANGRVEVLPLGGSLLGLFAGAEVQGTRVELRPGETLLLVTDGVLEARRHGTLFDDEGVARVLEDDVSSARAAAVALERAVLAHTGGVLSDDMAAVVLHVPNSG